MEKNITDYLPYYLGRDFVTPNSQGNLNVKTLHHVIALVENGVEVQLLLRKLESITDDELEERHFGSRNHYQYWLNCNRSAFPTDDLLWFLKNGFDVFDLIRDGLALEKQPATV